MGQVSDGDNMELRGVGNEVAHTNVVSKFAISFRISIKS